MNRRDAQNNFETSFVRRNRSTAHFKNVPRGTFCLAAERRAFAAFSTLAAFKLSPSRPYSPSNGPFLSKKAKKVLIEPFFALFAPFSSKKCFFDTFWRFFRIFRAFCAFFGFFAQFWGILVILREK